MKQLKVLWLLFATTTVGGGNFLTLSDWAKRRDPDGNTADIVEIIADVNEIIDDIMWAQANGSTGHTTTIRTGYPSGTWRLFNQGVQPSKSKTAQVTDKMGMLEDYSEVDASLASLEDDVAAFRFSEDIAFIQGLSESFASVLFYGSMAEPEKFTGFANRLTGTPQETDDSVSTFNIIDGGGTGSDNTSVWLVVWGAQTCFGIFPKGSKAGLMSTDKGLVTIENANGVSGARMEAYRTHYKWDCGLVLRDWRYVVRIANIDVSDLTKTGSTGADLVDLMVQATERLPSMGMGRASWYCNRTIRSYLRRQILNKSNVWLSMGEVAGKRVMMFDEIPVRRVDAILNTEATVA